MTDDVAARGPTAINRRRVLLGVSAAGVAGVLAACGGDDEPDALVDTTDPAEGPTDSTPEPVDPDDDADDDGGATDDADDAHAHHTDGDDALVATADVPVGAGVVLADDGVVVTQPSEGEFKAFSSTCTHQGCPVHSVEDALIRCVCHGSRFHIDDGSVANGPATRPLDEVSITVEGDRIVLT